MLFQVANLIDDASEWRHQKGEPIDRDVDDIDLNSELSQLVTATPPAPTTTTNVIKEMSMKSRLQTNIQAKVNNCSCWRRVACYDCNHCGFGCGKQDQQTVATAADGATANGTLSVLEPKAANGATCCRRQTMAARSPHEQQPPRPADLSVATFDNTNSDYVVTTNNTRRGLVTPGLNVSILTRTVLFQLIIVQATLVSTTSKSHLVQARSGWMEPDFPPLKEMVYCDKWRQQAVDEADKMLVLLQCEITPLFNDYLLITDKLKESGVSPMDVDEPSESNKRAAFGPAANEPTRSVSELEMRREFEIIRKKISYFGASGRSALESREFCTFPVINRLKELKNMAEESRSTLLTLAYDMVAIEYHKACLLDAIRNLPQVPYLVRDVVKIYIDGADKRLPDLNGDPSLDDDEDMEPFDVDRALAKNGSLRTVVGLLLVMPHNSRDNVAEFKLKCKKFLIDIEQRWQSMEMMNSMLANEGNGISRMNNYIMRKLTPTKYADICSQLVARDNDETTTL